MAYKNGVFSWIKLLFIPSVAKRTLPETEYHFIVYNYDLTIKPHSIICDEEIIEKHIQSLKNDLKIMSFRCIKGFEFSYFRRN